MKELKTSKMKKTSKPTKAPPMAARGKPKEDDGLSNPRAYLLGGDSLKAGYTAVAGDLDPHDLERNPKCGVISEMDEAEEAEDGGY